MSFDLVGPVHRYGEPEIPGQTYWHVTLRMLIREEGGYSHYQTVGMINVPADNEQEARNAVIAFLIRHSSADGRWGDENDVARYQNDPAITARCARQKHGYDDPAATVFTVEGIRAAMARHPESRKLLERHT